MSLKDFEEELRLLSHEELNLKKSINKSYLIGTLVSKLDSVTVVFTDIEQKLLDLQDKLSEEDSNYISKTAKQLYENIKRILEEKINASKMPADEAFDIKTATAIIQPYDGSAENLNAFIDATNLLKELTGNGQQAMLIKFVKTRLLGKARLGLPTNINTIEQLIADVKSRCEEKTTPENILAKFKQIKITGDLTSFCNEVENLTNKLKGIYLEKLIPENVAQSMATKAGVDTLIEKTSNLETKIILKAGSFGSISEAIQKVNEHSAGSNSAQVLKFTANRQQRPFVRNQDTRYNQSNNYQRNRQQNNNFRNNYQGNFRQNNQNFSPQHRRNFGRQNQYNTHPNFRNGRVYYAQQGNQAGPQQQHPVGGLSQDCLQQQLPIQQFARAMQQTLGQQTQQQPMICYQNQLTQSQHRP